MQIDTYKKQSYIKILLILKKYIYLLKGIFLSVYFFKRYINDTIFSLQFQFYKATMHGKIFIVATHVPKLKIL